VIHQILIAFACMAVVLGIGFALTVSEVTTWYLRLRKPSWQPPDWLFGPAWTTIGLLSVASAVIAWRSATTGAERHALLALFALNGVLNAGWSALFFKMRRPDWALIEVVPLWLSIDALMVAFHAGAPTASWLLAPYLVWVSFAACLNLSVVKLNRPFGRPAT
jgi:tryptophan-rich sensory protein